MKRNTSGPTRRCRMVYAPETQARPLGVLSVIVGATVRA
jgi:hypothetical protein